MSTPQTAPSAHFEIRYLINGELALRLRDYVREYLDFEEWCVGQPDFSAPVETLYLDSPDLRLFWDTVARPDNHLQLRVRRLHGAHNGPVTLEIKRRCVEGVRKEKALLTLPGMETLLGGELPEHDPLLRNSSGAMFTIEHFWELMQKFNARPCLRVTYAREGYVNDDGTIAVNFDRGVSAESRAKPLLKRPLASHWRMPRGQVVLELKFRDRFPEWFREMTETFDLSPTDVCKYRAGLDGLGANPGAPRE